MFVKFPTFSSQKPEIDFTFHWQAAAQPPFLLLWCLPADGIHCGAVAPPSAFRRRRFFFDYSQENNLMLGRFK